MKHFTKEYRAVLRQKGVVFDQNPSLMVERVKITVNGRPSLGDISLAMDAQPGLTTVSNSGIPAYLTNYLDPKPIEVLFSPMNATNVFDERVAGDWTQRYWTFKFVEHTGETSAYGDFSESGMSGMNVNFPERQSFLSQTITQYGDLEVADTALAQLDLVSGKTQGAIIALNRWSNLSYLFGVEGLRCYGMLNDPSLPAYIAPGAKTYNSLATGPWITNGMVTATPNEVYKDVQSLYYQLVAQTQGLVDMKSSMKMVMSPLTEVALTATNETFATNAIDLIKKNFPNLTTETVPEYATSAGNVIQLIATEIMGQKTGECATNLKLRTGRIIPGLSSFKQKRSQGTWGAIIYQPFAIAQMIGL